jgi:phospholipid/cholesterol/gamma-HCH transport system substrate-binding protein
VASKKTQFTVGLFLIMGLTIITIAVVWLGMSHYFEKGKYYVAYFDESVQGLDTDSPVKYRGVPVGRVESIGVAPDATLIQIVMKIESELKNRENIVAQLKSVGITGIMFIELDQKIEDEPDVSPRIRFPSKYPVIATKPSGIKMFFEGVSDLLKQMKELDAKVIAENFKLTLDSINHALKEAQIGGLVTDIRSSFKRIEKILDERKWEKSLDSIEKAATSFDTFSKNADKTVLNINQVMVGLDRNIEDIEKEFRQALSDLSLALENTNAFIEKGSGFIVHTDDRFSSLHRHLLISLNNLDRASENLNRFLERVADQPSLLIFGEPPPYRTVEPIQ